MQQGLGSDVEEVTKAVEHAMESLLVQGAARVVSIWLRESSDGPYAEGLAWLEVGQERLTVKYRAWLVRSGDSSVKVDRVRAWIPEPGDTVLLS
mgnify:CR=1 FL=1